MDIALETQPAIVSPALAAKFTAFLDVSGRSADTYSRALRQFMLWLESNNIKNPCREDVLRFREGLRSTKSAATVQSYMTTVRLFFRWTAQEGLYPNVADNIKSAPISKNYKKDYLTSSQAAELLSSIPRVTLAGLRDYALILLMLTGGLRAIETVRADINDMRTLGDCAVLYIQGKGKQDKADYAKLPAPAERAIREYLRSRGETRANAPLFASLSNNNSGGRLSTRAVNGIVKTHMRAIGLDSPRLSAHSLRHTAGTLNLLHGGTLEETQQLLRHSNINTTMIYLHHLERAKNQSEQRIADAILGI